MSAIADKFFGLLRSSIGTQNGVEEVPTNEEWKTLLNMSVKQSLAGVMFLGFEKTVGNNSQAKPPVLYEWIGLRQSIVSKNALLNKRTAKLAGFLKKNGFKNCVLKGQGTALYYDKAELRQSGDIDLWVKGERDKIVDFVRSKGVKVESVDIKDATMDFFDDVVVEVHFRPNCMFNPWTNHRLQSFFKEKAERQFDAWDEKKGFAHTTIDFDLVYSLVHIYRHIFSEGIGLRQLIDYYYILIRSDRKGRDAAFQTIRKLGMKSFAGGVMYILQEKLGMCRDFAVCEKNARHGEFLLREIMTGGNFGQYDTRYQFADKDKKFMRGFAMLKRNMHFVMLYPSEVLWSPVWKLWHWCWRKYKGYL